MGNISETVQDSDIFAYSMWPIELHHFRWP